MNSQIDDQALLDRWRELLESRRDVSRGLIVENRPCPFSEEWFGIGNTVWNYERDLEPPLQFDVLVLKDLDPKLLNSKVVESEVGKSHGLSVLRAATLAIRLHAPILVHTTGPFNSLRVPASTEESPFQLNPSTFLAGEELAYLLQANCELMVPEYSKDSGALYLTPIERRLAEKLAEQEIDFKSQVKVDRYTVDFLIDEKLVVECDGEGWHDPAHDVERDRKLELLDFSVLRFTGRAIHSDVDSCIKRIKEARQGSTVERYMPSFDMTDAQRKAASHIDGPALVVAPAGSGKTRVIEERVRMLLSSGVEQNRICVFSFTNAAVGEVRGRLESFPDVEIRTLNSFGNEIVGDHFGKMTIIENHRDPRIPTPLRLIKDILIRARRKFPIPHSNNPSKKDNLRILVEELHKYRSSFILPLPENTGLYFESDLEVNSASNLEGKPTQTDNRSEVFLLIHEQYEEVMRSRSLIDFNGQIIEAIRLLAANPAIRLKNSERFDFWLVDEFQDLSMPKILLMRLLASPARNLMVVGDDDQIIYGFAGAKPQSFAFVQRDWRDTTQLPLDINFRSPHELVVRTRWLIERNVERVPKDTKPFRPLVPDNSVFTSFNGNYAEAAVEEFMLLRANRSTADVIFLFRSRIAAAPVELLLMENGIRFTPISHGSILYDPTAILVLSWLRVVNSRIGDANDPALKSAWETVLRRPNRYLSKKTIDWFIGKADVFATIESAVTVNCDGLPRANESQSDDLLNDSLRSLILTIQNARRFPDDLGVQLDILKLDEVLQKDEEKQKHDQKINDLKTVRDGQSADPLVIYSVMKVLASSAVTWDVLSNFIEESQGDGSINWEIDSVGDVGADVLRLSTIHSFKGREAPIVFVLGPSERHSGYMPDRRARNDGEIEEERRVAYVAATRAREKLYFWCSEDYAHELTNRQDGLTWQMYREGLTEPPKVAIPPVIKHSPVRPMTVHERQPGLLERALDWLLKLLD
jgi:DNA helicase-2/ATP-dependent DNA helicase PcrA